MAVASAGSRGADERPSAANSALQDGRDRLKPSCGDLGGARNLQRLELFERHPLRIAEDFTRRIAERLTGGSAACGAGGLLSGAAPVSIATMRRSISCGTTETVGLETGDAPSQRRRLQARRRRHVQERCDRARKLGEIAGSELPARKLGEITEHRPARMRADRQDKVGGVDLDDLDAIGDVAHVLFDRAARRAADRLEAQPALQRIERIERPDGAVRPRAHRKQRRRMAHGADGIVATEEAVLFRIEGPRGELQPGGGLERRKPVGLGKLGNPLRRRAVRLSRRLSARGRLLRLQPGAQRLRALGRLRLGVVGKALAPFEFVDPLPDEIEACQQVVDHFGIEVEFAAAHFVEQILGGVREAHQRRNIEQPGRPFQRVNSAKHIVDDVSARRARAPARARHSRRDPRGRALRE